MPSTSVRSDPRLYRAAFYDGKSAVRHEVAVRLRDTALDIVTPAGEVVAQWLYGEVVFADQGSGGYRVAKVDSEARLVFKDATAFEALRGRAPDMHTPHKRARRGMVLAIAATVAILIGGYLATPVLTSAIVAMTPLSLEVKLGRNYANSIIDLVGGKDGKGVCESNTGALALAKIVKELSRHTHSPAPYEVRVLDVKMVNAVALPGGFIFVFRGLLDAAQSQDELVGVLAHEMAHVDQRHPMQAMVRSYGISLLSDMMFGGSAMGGVSSTLMSTSYSRNAEEAADSAAIETLHEANLSTQGLADFFERLAAQEDGGLGLPEFLSTHPDTGVRERRARTPGGQGRAILRDGEWQALREICT